MQKNWNTCSLYSTPDWILWKYVAALTISTHKMLLVVQMRKEKYLDTEWSIQTGHCFVTHVGILSILEKDKKL